MNKAIITGVTGGLGSELAQQLLAKNYQVVGISRTAPDNLAGIKHISCDLTDKGQLAAMVEQIKSEDPDFSVLFNCAGMLSIQPLAAIDYDEMEKLFKLNVLAYIALTSGLIDLIKVNKADVVNVGSTIGYKSYSEQMAYTASKWAVRGINANLKLELQGSGCRVIGFNPGGFKSEIFEKATGVKTEDWSGWMDAKDIAAFLISLVELPKNMEVTELVLNRN